MVYNWLGKPLNIQSEYVLINDSFKRNDGSIDWLKYAKFSDDEGFDIRENAKLKEVILEKGLIIARYGVEYGKYTAPAGTQYESLSLPYLQESVPYHEYLVIDDIKVVCIVKSGIVAPNFFQSGGGIQFLHKMSIAEEIERGALQEVFEWIKKWMT